jgi:tetratricopeptide (TPR) repeat protein/TolB-like protein
VACGITLTGESVSPTRITPAPGKTPPAGAGESQESTPPRRRESAPSEIGTVISKTSQPSSAGGYQQSLVTLEPGDRLGGRYEITALLGTGGMGVVYRARDMTLDRDVALKVIRPDMAQHSSIMDRFRREILLASKVTHKNILRIHDLAESDGLSYISMNFIEGENLEDLLEREGALPPERALDIAVQMARALQAAHEADVVHRDLKPQNILLDNDGVAYVADFGLSRSLEPGRTMTETGMILGTFNYMSPEQARGETHDHRGDIYAFGLILYEMLTGELPFRAEGGMSSMLKRVHEEAPKVTKIRRGVPTWLAGIISRSMKRDPESRYQSAADLLADLKARRASWALRQMLRPKKLAKLGGVLAGAAVAIVAIMIGVNILLEGRSEKVIAPKASLAILPFSNATGNPDFDWTRTGLPNLIHTDLNQTKALRLVAEDRVQGILDNLKLGSEGNYRTDAVHRVSGILGVENVLTGNLMKAGERFRIEAIIQNAADGSVATDAPIQVEGRGEESLFTMVDALTERIREELGVARGWGEKDLGVTDLSTNSIPALGFYEQGLTYVRIGNDTEAASFLEQAVEADPEFAIARSILAETYDRLGFSKKAKQEAGRAVGALALASPYEAARVRAVYARLEGDLDEAEASYRSLVDFSPNSAEANLELALVLEEMGNLEESFSFLQKTLELDPQNPEAHFFLGRVKVKMGNAASAIQDFNTALGYHRESGNAEGRAKVLNGLGYALDDLGRSEEAMERFVESLTIHEEVGDRLGMGSALNNLAVILMSMGRLEEAIEKEERAITIGHEVGDPSYLGNWYSTLGDIYQTAGRPRKALDAYQMSLRFARDSNDEEVLAWNLGSVGYINVVLGNYLEAGIFLKDTLEKRREMGNKNEIARALTDMGIVEQLQGRYEEALEYILEGLDLAREIDNKITLGVLLANLSNVHEDQGNYGAALKVLSEAEAMAREIGAEELLATLLTYSGSVRSRLGDPSGAAEALVEALGIARDLEHVELVSEIEANRSYLNRCLIDFEKAASTARNSFRFGEESGNHRLNLLARLRLAEANRSREDLERIATELDSSGLVPLLNQARLSLANLLFESGNLEAASRTTAELIDSAGNLQERDLLIKAHHLSGRIALRQENDPEARRQFSEGLENLERIAEGLDGVGKIHLLGRSDTANFLRDARKMFPPEGGTEESSLLDRFVSP